MQTISEMLQSSVSHFPDKAFIHFGDRSITYAEFDGMASRLANVLANHGVSKGTPVGLYLPSRPELAAGYHACQKLGAIAVPMSNMYRRNEVEGIATRTEMPVLVTDDGGVELACTLRSELDSLVHVLTFGDDHDQAERLQPLMAAASGQRDLEPCAPDDVAVLFFTSGTTGQPKGAMQTHRSVYFTLRDMEVYNRFQFGREVILDVLPIFNNFGATCLMMGTVYNSGTMVMHQRWDTDQVLADIGTYGVTFFAGTPTMFVYMWKAYDEDEHDLSTMRLGVTGGAPVPPEVLDGCQAKLGLDVTQIYGATETSGYITGEPVVGVRKRGSAGTPFGTATIGVVDDFGERVKQGEVGEVIVGGDTIGAGYWRDPETTKSIFTPGGWRSGDLGYVDEDGYLFIVDRKKDLIISGGYNIYPIEVEDVLYRHSKVHMCAVVGLPDEVKGEIPIAFVVPMEDPSAELGEELRLYCRENMAAYKAPRHVEFIDEMPLGPSGKILKRKLREYPVDLER